MGKPLSQQLRRGAVNKELVVVWESVNAPGAGSDLRKAFELILGEEAVLLKPERFDKKGKTRKDNATKVAITRQSENTRTTT